MKRLLYALPVLLLVALIVTPKARADSYAPAFTCNGTCLTGVPSGPDISFPITGEAVDYLFTLPAGNQFLLAFFPQDSPTDTYSWSIDPTTADEARFTFTLSDLTNGKTTDDSTLGGISGFTGESGTMSFSPVSASAPEPAPVALVLLGVGLIVLMRKHFTGHIAHTA